MKMRCSKKFMSYILCMMLIVAMAICTIGCSDKKEDNMASQEVVESQDDAAQGEQENVSEDDAAEEEQVSDVTVLGEGQTIFDFTVVDFEGNESKFEIHTDKEIVGEALMELNLIEGEEGAYGLYVKNVNGIQADYDTDGTYWAFYVNDEYAMSGVDTTKIEEGKSYSFKVSK